MALVASSMAPVTPPIWGVSTIMASVGHCYIFVPVTMVRLIAPSSSALR